MIAKTVTGSDFEGALTYGAGLRKGKSKEPGDAPVFLTNNVIPGTPKQMAQQMQATAATSNRIKKPVWHTVLSWKAGEVVSPENKREAVRRYCELMGAPVERHQIVVFEHKDKKHAHVHIYLNRVPIDGGPALRASNNFYKQPKVTKQIREELKMQPLPERRQSVKDLDPTKEAAREAVRQAVQRLLAQQGRGGPEWLQEQLSKEKIEVRYTYDKGNVLRGVSFEMGGVAVKGQEIGYKGAAIREALRMTPAPAVTKEVTPPQEQPGVVKTPEQPTVQNIPGPKKKGPRI